MCPDQNESDVPKTERIEKVVDLIEIAGRLAPSTVVVAGGHRVEDLRLVESARDHGIVDRIILVGLRDRIAKAVAEVGIEIETKDIVPAENDEQSARAAVEIIKTGEVDIVLKGGISTPIINRHMLPLAVRSTVSLTTIFDAACIAGGRPIILTDAGVTTVCNFGRMQDLVRNAVDVAQTVMGIDRPRVAILSANEKQVPSLTSTWMGLEMAKRSWPDAIVCGPLSFDLATDPESVSVKGLPDSPGAAEVAGKADVLVCPGIDAANAIYKIISALNKYGEASLANITIGFPVPYGILSRADSVETRLVSVALCAVYAQRTSQRQTRGKSPEATMPLTIQKYHVLAVNPGSMSLKVALYENDRCVQHAEVLHGIVPGGSVTQRHGHVEHLMQLISGVLDQWAEQKIDAVAARGGFLPRLTQKLSGGAYLVAEKQNGHIIVDEAIVTAARDYPEKEHASNFGVPLAAALAKKLGVLALVVDPVVVDEFIPEAEVSGYEPIVRRSISHALSIRAATRRVAQESGRRPEDISLVAAHLGGGITVAAVRGGKIIDNNIALLGGGPFTPQRAGDLPMGDLIELCYGGRFTRDSLIDELTKKGGLWSYLGTDRMEEVERRIANGDERARLVTDAMVYQIAKEIGKAFVAAGCDVEAIVLTGGLTRSKWLTSALRRRVVRLAPVIVYEGSLEMAALAEAAIDVLSGRRLPLRYETGQSEKIRGGEI